MWFLRDLSKTPESWIFAFTLALLEGQYSSDGIAWVDFCRFYQVLRDFIHEWVADTSDGLQSDKNSLRYPRPLDELELLESTQSEIFQDSEGPRLLVKFRDKRHGLLLRTIILNNNRALVISLVPLFMQIAETADVGQRIIAARVIGVIGEIDGNYIVRPLIEKWSAMDAFQQRALVGHMFQGAWKSSNGGYLRYIKSEIEKLASRRERLWTAIAAYKQVGMVDLEAAFKGLKGIAERNLAKYLEDVPEVVRRFESIERNYSAITSDRESAIAVSVVCKLLMDFYQDLFSEENEIALSFQYTMVSLCIVIGPEKVFAELRHWIHERRGLGALVSLMFLQERGIAAELADRPLEVPVSGHSRRSKTILCNPVVVVMSGTDKSVIQDVADFLESVFEGYYYYFPAGKGRLLTQTFLNHLKGWAFSAKNSKAHTEAMEDLLLKLLSSLNKPLREHIYYWLKDDLDFVQGELRPIKDVVLEKWQPL
jgi:hypothetical protein